MKLKTILLQSVVLFAGAAIFAQAKDPAILNVSYDISRELYKDLDPAFQTYWKSKTGETLVINQSHGGSTKQARSVIEGLEADVVTMNQETDVDAISKAGLLAPTWRKQFPNNSSPYSSTIIFLVRKGNPKGIKDWDDLIKPGVSVVIPNPKTSGNGRYGYLAAWGYALHASENDPVKAKDFILRLFKNVPVLDTGGRAATTTFTQHGIGDVLLTFEAEVFLLAKDVGGEQFDVVVPPTSIEADAPIAVVDRYASRHGTQAAAKAFVEFHWSREGQDIIARHYFRPRLKSVALKYSGQFKPIELFTVDQVAGGWDKAQKDHFADGGYFDQIYAK
jgi:sulfate transport system substrate-binding protein